MANIYGNFVWWQGVVEDIMDPLMIGRCKVRILGYHTDDKIEIPTEDLPWATPMQPITSAAISGIGTTPLGPVEGTWVVGFFRDGEDAQEPVIMGTVGGIPEEGPDPEKGFNDPYGMYPLDSHLADEYREVPEGSHNYIPKENEPDTNRLARGNFVIPTKNSKCLTDEEVPLSNGENSESLKWKRATRQEAVPKALAGNLSSSIDNTNEKIYATNVGGTTTNLEENLDDFSIAGVSITNAGSGYVTAPAVVFTGGGATTAAAATAYINENGESTGVVTSVKVDSVGEGYTSVPTVAFSVPPEGGTQATGTVAIFGEDVSGITIDEKEKDPTTYADDENYYWNEPHPRYGGVKKSKTEFATEYSSCYPYNKVRQSESGHVEEWDDTPGAERLHRYHGSGTFEEIQADGTRVVKVLGNDYEIVADDKNVLVSGDCNITVEGNCRLLTMGSMVQDVRGHYHLNVAGDMRVKVGGNMVQEIMSARKIKVEKDDDLKVGKDQIMNIGINAKKQIGKDYSVVAGGAFSTTSGANTSITADTSVFIDALLNLDLTAGAIAGLGGGITTNITATAMVNVTSPVGIINLIALDINLLGDAMVNIVSPLIDNVAGGIFSAAGPVINEASGGHLVESGIYIATCGLIELN